MNKATLISIATATILFGCTDGDLLALSGTPPKKAAELCNAWAGDATPSADQAKIVAAYKTGEIPFEECMRRLRN